jgi:pSer/pThr/pTyr-binding forkhead associated (FHA) protein
MHVNLIEVVSGEIIAIGRLPAVIGRDPSADVRIDDPALPPYQCMVGKDGDGVMTVWSLRPEFPVYVNGEMTAKAALRDGDELSIGKRRFVVQLSPFAPRKQRDFRGAKGDTLPVSPVTTMRQAQSAEADAGLRKQG